MCGQHLAWAIIDQGYIYNTMQNSLFLTEPQKCNEWLFLEQECYSWDNEHIVPGRKVLQLPGFPDE